MILMSEVLRILIIVSSNVFYEIYYINRFFKSHRSLTFFYIVAFGRVIIYNCLLMTYLPSVYGNASWLTWLCYDGEVLLLIALLAALYYTYSHEADALKIYSAFAIGDIFFGLLIMVPMIVVNGLEGRAFFLITAPFHPFDLLIPVLEGIIVYGLVKASGRLFVSFQNLTIRHRRIVSGLVVAFYIISIIDAANPHSIGGIVTFFLFACLMIFYFLFTFTLAQRVQRKRAALQFSQELMNSHFKAIQETIDALDEQRQEIDEKMTELMAHDFPEDLTQDYLEDMKARKQQIHTTLFTDFYMIDALLSSKANEYETRGIACDIKITVTDLGVISQLSLCQILLALLQYGEEEGMTDVALQMAELKNMLVITMAYSFMPRLKSVRKKIEKLSTGLTCDMTQEGDNLILAIHKSINAL